MTRYSYTGWCQEQTYVHNAVIVSHLWVLVQVTIHLAMILYMPTMCPCCYPMVTSINTALFCINLLR